MEPNELAVVQGILDGNTELFRHLVDRHSRPLFRLAYRMMRNETDADDVVQETFFRAYRNLSLFDARAGLGTWLHRIATNYALDLLRRRKREKLESEESLPESLPESCSSDESLTTTLGVRSALDHGIGLLTANERTAFVLRHHEGMSIDEIGQVLGTESNATKNTIFRAVRKLRTVLQPLVSSTVRSA